MIIVITDIIFASIVKYFFWFYAHKVILLIIFISSGEPFFKYSS